MTCDSHVVATPVTGGQLIYKFPAVYVPQGSLSYHKSPPMSAVLIQESPLHSLTHYFSGVHFSTPLLSDRRVSLPNVCILFSPLPPPTGRVHPSAPNPMEQCPLHHNSG